MTADLLFQITSVAALAGWIILATGAAFDKPILRDILAGRVWPFAFSVLYALLIGAFFFKADGGFDSLANVQKLFTSPWVALAGWVHYLAFDLFIGAVIVRKIMQLRISRLFLLILLPLTLMFGPVGYATFVILRTGLAKQELAA